MASLRTFVQNEIRSSISVKEEILGMDALTEEIACIAELCVSVFRSGNRILLAGNGGSAADAQHIAAEFVSRFMFDRPGLPALSLTTDPSTVTAIGNDYGYENLFSRQLQANGRPGDLFIGISTSGKSPNILRGFKTCRELGIHSVALTGKGGIQAMELADHCLMVPSSSTARIQESHILIGHVICAIVERLIFGDRERL